MTRIKRLHAAVLAVCLAAAGASPAAPPEPLELVWDSPSADARGSMPLGNGDISLNVWVEPSGDLLMYIGKTDSWGDNARLLKVGRLRLSFTPSPLANTKAFRQTLRLRDGTIEVRYGEAAQAVTAKVWVDAYHPVIHVTADSPRDVAATAVIELWRTKREELPSIECSDIMLDRAAKGSKHGPTFVEPDTLLTDQAGRIGWYHRNIKSVGPALTMKVQGLRDVLKADPLLGRTFGAIVTAEGGKRVDDRTLASPAGRSHRFSIHVATRQPATPQQWLAAMEKIIAQAAEAGFDARRRAHEQWWSQFWQRSWVRVTAAAEPAARPLVPASRLPVRIGLNQHGSNRFAGQLGRVSVLARGLSAEEVARLAGSPRDKPLDKRPGLLFSEVGGQPRDVAGSKAFSFPKGLTAEAWVCPDKLPSAGARIVDRVTPGGSDGFLLDTWPGNSARFIVAAATLTQRDGLPAGKWSHVAGVVDQAAATIRLYVNGRLAAEQKLPGLDAAALVSRGYQLQRFVTACAGRGRYPIKFNGTIFTVPWPGKCGDADYRRWGPGYWWQNTRLPYLGMCAAGDFDLMEPLWRMYCDEVLPVCVERTRRYCGHEGAFFPECIYFWGAIFSETYGWTPFEKRGADKLQSSGWHKWEWVSGPELVWMMLDYYDYTLDEAFLKRRLLPAAHEVLTFFDRHYGTGADGKLVMQPSQALETWWRCTNAMPELAGLWGLTERLLALPEELTTDRQRAFWAALRKKLPDLPTREADGKPMLAPAAEFAAKRNSENPELYAVFPFRQVAVGRPKLDLGIEALRHRWDKGHFGWRQDDIFMAYLGLADEARDNLARRAASWNKQSRFPAFWGPNYDWVPDQDHGGVLMKALQSMLLQTDGRRIFLLPAWPAGWDASFKLHAPQKTTVECDVRGGKVRRLQVTPESRRKDIVPPPSSSD